MTKLPVKIIDVYFNTETPRKGIFEPVSEEDLAKGIKESLGSCANCFDNKYAFSFFKLVSEEPERAEKLLLDVIDKNKEMKKRNLLLKEIKKDKVPYCRLAYDALKGAYQFYGIDFKPAGLVNIFGMIKVDSRTFLNESKEIYDELSSKEGTSSSLFPELKTISNALDSSDFGEGGHFYLKEKMSIPDSAKMFKECVPNMAEVALHLASKFNTRPRYFEEIRWTGHGEEKNHFKLAGFLIEGKELGEETKYLVETKGAYSDDPTNNEVTMIYKTSRDTPDDRFIKKVWGRSWHKVFVETPIKEAFGGRKQSGYDDISEVGEQLPYKLVHPGEPSVSEIWKDRRDLGAAPEKPQ